ncbi:MULTISPECIES: M23 family metallopeptidase [Methylomonas]|uniref:M23ase beta-sheet core domain-containing protein n=2 Tax=Methylomonas TaxID=416 RepID=A0A140E3M5_9GAMM|nr:MULTISPECIES: M23 family metallopeptidase [Methylomonas]AMK74999.1 hypothetical protein JT25_000610 [Methylomonas denitrificans]OAI02496.1 hypothetical protein A1342_01610 [Methylomonas methanica]TCV83188.1 peptidase M23-like protein [Methylomonas methanica]
MKKFYYPLERMQFRNDSGLRNVIGATYGKDARKKNGHPKWHQGWDLYAQVGTDCFAIADGIVLWTKQNSGDYGTQLLLQFNRDGSAFSSSDCLFAFYAHLSKMSVTPGTFVTAGQKLAETGISGNASIKYPHLHFEIRKTSAISAGKGEGNRIDPGYVLGFDFMSCRSENIGGIDFVTGMSIKRNQPTPIKKL